MKISSVNNSSAVYKNQEKLRESKQEDKKTSSARRPDTLELSVEALNYEPIKQKIREGFYNMPDTMNEVAMKLSKEIPPDTF